MGSACCVAAKERTVSNQISMESTHRNLRHSPSSSFRWEGESQLEDTEDNNYSVPMENYRNDRLERKRRLIAEHREIETPSAIRNCRGHMRTSPESDVSGFSPGSTFFIEERNSAKTMTPSNPSVYTPTPSPPSFSSTSKFAPSTPQFALPDFNPSRRSPVPQHSRQASDNQVFTFRSPNEASTYEGRHSFMLSAGSSDFRNGGSFGGSSDGWSMRTFSELLTSRRERWSFDSENTLFNMGKLTPLMSPTVELQGCGMCSKLLKQPPNSCTAFPVVAILFCGHAFHTECLDTVTSEANKTDPLCPICTVGDKRAFKVGLKSTRAEKELRTKNKLSRIGIADGDVDHDLTFVGQKRGNKSLRLEASSSMKGSFAKPFLRRHFSLGGMKFGRVASDEEPTNSRKKGFWSRYRKN